MTKSKFDQNWQNGPTARDSLRQQLEREFVAMHGRRRLRRRAAMIGSASVLLALCAWGILAVNRDSFQKDSSMADRNQPSVHSGDSSPKTPEKPVFTAIQVTELSDGDVRDLLDSLNSNWFVAEIDGQQRAFTMN